MKEYLKKTFFDIPIFYQNSIIGLLLIVAGIIFLFNPSNLNLKVSASLILIGVFIIMILNINEKSIKRNITGKQFTGIIILMIFFVFIITYNIEADIFLIITILGIITLREFLFEFMSILLKKRMTILFYFLIITFSLVIGQRVINILYI